MSGCGSDTPTESAPVRLARKGEVCATTNDCAPGLACLPDTSGVGRAGVCVIGVFNVPETSKECAVVECQVAADCCEPPAANCDLLKEACDADRDAGTSGTSTACTQYEQQCLCDTNQRACESGKCVTKCVNDSTCAFAGSPGGKCLGGKCAQCASDDDCGSSDLICVSGKCQSPCQGDGDCPGFDRCLGGRCVDGACQTDRECIAATRNVEAKCGTDGKCIVPCQSDPECGSPKDYGFFSCVDGQCKYMGCESDKDCRLYVESLGPIGSSGGTGGLTSNQHIVCREKPIPGAPDPAPAP